MKSEAFYIAEKINSEREADGVTQCLKTLQLQPAAARARAPFCLINVGAANDATGRVFHDLDDWDGGRLPRDGLAGLAPAGWRPSAARQFNFHFVLCLHVFFRGLDIGMRPNNAV